MIQKKGKHRRSHLGGKKKTLSRLPAMALSAAPWQVTALGAESRDSAAEGSKVTHKGILKNTGRVVRKCRQRRQMISPEVRTQRSTGQQARGEPMDRTTSRARALPWDLGYKLLLCARNCELLFTQMITNGKAFLYARSCLCVWSFIKCILKAELVLGPFKLSFSFTE